MCLWRLSCVWSYIYGCAWSWMLLCQNEESVAAWAAEEKPPFLKYYRECHLGAWLTEGFFFCMNWVHSLWNTEKLFSKCPLLWQHPRGTPSPASGYFLCLNRCRVGQSLLSPKCSCLFSSHRTWGGGCSVVFPLKMIVLMYQCLTPGFPCWCLGVTLFGRGDLKLI